MDQGSTPVHNLGLESEAVAAALPSAPISGVYRRSPGTAARDYLGSFLFVVPFLLFFGFFTIWPLIYAFWVSLHTWTTVSGDHGFVGLTHYYNLFFQYNTFDTVRNYWSGMKVTVFFAIISVPLLVLVALIFALLLASGPFRSFFRTVYYVPAVLSITVAMTVWLWILQEGGIASTYLHRDIPWLIDQPWAWVSIFLATLWWTPGFNMIILLAGIIDVPGDYHEAAKIDGANGLQRILYITIPLLRPVLAFVTITQMIASFGLFGQPFLLTHGGPGTSTTPVALSMYNEAFGADQNLGLASAESFVLGIILIIIAVIQLRFFRAAEM
jgi:multiple sugar transport system permease protein